MNSKKAKLMRSMARRMALRPDGSVWPDRGLIVHPAHEQRAQEKGLGHVSAINAPQTTRGVYRWLKRNFNPEGDLPGA